MGNPAFLRRNNLQQACSELIQQFITAYYKCTTLFSRRRHIQIRQQNAILDRRMWARLLKLFQIPEFADSELNVVARMTQRASVGMVVLSLIFIGAAALVAPALLLRALVLTITFSVTCIGVVALIRTQHLQIASTLLVIIMWLAITLGTITAGGVSAPIFIGYLVVVLASGLLTGQRLSLLVSTACIVAGIGIVFAERYNLLPQPMEYNSLARLGIYTFFLVVTILLQTINRTNMQGLLQQARESEARYRSLLENIPTTTYINSTDEAARTEYVSPQVEKLLGFPRQAFLNDPEFWKKILHPEDQARVMAANAPSTYLDDTFNLEYRLVAHDGRVIWVRDEANLVRNAAGDPLYWLGVWTDITSRKQAEEEQADLVSVMTKRTIQLQTAAEVSRAATSILDLENLLPTIVNLICSHFDYYYVGIFLTDEAGEWAVLRAATGDTGEKMIAAGHRLKVEDSSMIGWSIKNRQARIALDVGVDAVRFKNPNLPLTRSEIALPLITRGEVIGAMTIQSNRPAAFSRVDVTALQSMANLVTNAIENARLFTERAGLISELEARNAELEQFSYTVSHDLRSPLVTIRGFLGYLQQDAKAGDMSRFDKDLKRISSAVDKMQALLNDLLELSRIGRAINPPELVSFGQITAEAVELVDGLLVKNNVRVQVQDPLPEVYGDHARLVEALQNLISNAAKFMGSQPQPVIEIGTTGLDEDQNLVFFVRDNGVGIDPQYHERIFGLFNRLDPTIEGTGIGLTLVRRIIEIHHGRVWLESSLGHGTTFFFTLPSQPESEAKP